MQFGKVENEIISSIDFSLPPDTDMTREMLKAGRGNPQFFIGCAKWGRPDWVGKIYPPKTKASDFLYHYARHFNSIELNATYYKIPDAKTVTGWKSKVGKDFRFVPKFKDSITHLKRLRDVDTLVNQFLEGIYAFGENLGPVFLMPHPQMSPAQIETIIQFLDSLPQDLDLFVEVRHPNWFNNDHTLFQELRARGRGSLITDSSGRQDCVHMNLTTPECFIRFVGNSLDVTDYTRVDEWVERLKLWIAKGIERIYFFMHQHDELHSPELISYLIKKLNEQCKLNVRIPQFFGDSDAGKLWM